MFKLTKAKENVPLILTLVKCGHCLMYKLNDMGLLPGERIKVLNNPGHGPVTVKLKGSKVALGQGLAENIIVKEEKNEE